MLLTSVRAAKRAGRREREGEFAPFLISKGHSVDIGRESILSSRKRMAIVAALGMAPVRVAAGAPPPVPRDVRTG